jgi:hypothetical protein
MSLIDVRSAVIAAACVDGFIIITATRINCAIIAHIFIASYLKITRIINLNFGEV